MKCRWLNDDGSCELASTKEEPRFNIHAALISKWDELQAKGVMLSSFPGTQCEVARVNLWKYCPFFQPAP